jgi:hypothetical protein
VLVCGLFDFFLRARRDVGFVFSELAVSSNVPRRQAVFLDEALVAGERAVFAGFDAVQRLVAALQIFALALVAPVVSL